MTFTSARLCTYRSSYESLSRSWSMGAYWLSLLLAKNCRNVVPHTFVRKIAQEMTAITLSSRVVVTFEKPVGDVAVGFQRVLQRRHCLSGQVTSSFRYVKRDGVRGVDNRMTGWSCAAWVEEERNMAAFCPRVEYRSGLRLPSVRCRDYHAHHCTTTSHNVNAILHLRSMQQI